MKEHPSFWTPERKATARAIVADCRKARESYGQMAHKISLALGFPVTRNAVDGLIQRGLEGDAVAAATHHDTLSEEPDHFVEPPSVASLEEEFAENSKLNGLRAANKMLLKELAARDTQIQTLTELRNQRGWVPITAPHKVGGHQRSGVPVMVLSDLHVEERVTPEKTNGLNLYTPEIAATCIDKCADDFIWLHDDHRYDCRTAVVAIIGDTFSGYIHTELQETNFMAPTLACLWLQDRLEGLLRRIAKETDLERIIVVMKDGNHGRMTQKMRASTRTENSLEWLMFKTLAARLSDDPRFECIVEEGIFSYLDVYKTGLCFAHGDIWRSAGGVGGITIPLRKGFNERKKYPRKLDHLIIGHFHTRLDIGEIIVNGSMIGVTPWSLAQSFAPEPRQQTWFLVDSEYGKTLSAPIILPQYAA